MAFVPFANTIKAEMVYTAENSVFENVLHFTVGGGVDDDKQTDLGTSLIAWWHVYTRQAMGTAVNLVLVRTTSLESDSAPGFEFPADAPIDGSAAGEILPMNVSAEIILTTGLRGRSFRGRIYHAGLVEAMTQGSTIILATRELLYTCYSQLISLAGATYSYQLVVASRQHNNVPRVSGVTTAVQDMIVQQHVVSQRRRLPGRGT